MRLIALAALTLAVVPFKAAASDGNELLQDCGSAVRWMDGEKFSTPLNIGFCLGLMQGITNTGKFYEVIAPEKALFCLPENGIENRQAARVVVNYLSEHPEQLHENDVILAVKAFAAAYPCRG